MTPGQKCHGLICKVLDTMELDIEQKAKLDKAMKSNGTYEPENVLEDITDINEMLMDGDTNGLLSRLKIYPPAPLEQDIIYYIDGVECSRPDFNNSDKIYGIRTIEGKGAPKEDTNLMWKLTGARLGSNIPLTREEENQKNSIMRNATRGSGRPGGEFSSDHERM